MSIVFRGYIEDAGDYISEAIKLLGKAQESLERSPATPEDFEAFTALLNTEAIRMKTAAAAVCEALGVTRENYPFFKTSGRDKEYEELGNKYIMTLAELNALKLVLEKFGLVLKELVG